MKGRMGRSEGRKDAFNLPATSTVLELLGSGRRRVFSGTVTVSSEGNLPFLLLKSTAGSEPERARALVYVKPSQHTKRY